MKPALRVARIGLLLSICSCAGVSYESVPYTAIPFNDKDPSATLQSGADLAREQNLQADLSARSGFRYYGTSLYLLVYPNGKGSVVWRLLELPDATKKRIVEPYNFLASLETNLVFQDGTLSDAKVAANAEVVPLSIITELAKAAVPPKAPLEGKSSEEGKEEQNYSIALYKVVTDPKTGAYELRGVPFEFKHSDLFPVPVTEPKP